MPRQSRRREPAWAPPHPEMTPHDPRRLTVLPPNSDPVACARLRSHAETARPEHLITGPSRRHRTADPARTFAGSPTGHLLNLPLAVCRVLQRPGSAANGPTRLLGGAGDEHAGVPGYRSGLDTPGVCTPALQKFWRPEDASEPTSEHMPLRAGAPSWPGRVRSPARARGVGSLPYRHPAGPPAGRRVRQILGWRTTNLAVGSCWTSRSTSCSTIKY